jgi:hypothetical protein
LFEEAIQIRERTKKKEIDEEILEYAYRRIKDQNAKENN